MSKLHEASKKYSISVKYYSGLVELEDAFQAGARWALERAAKKLDQRRKEYAQDRIKADLIRMLRDEIRALAEGSGE